MRRLGFAIARMWPVAIAAGLASSCGSRTGLFIDEGVGSTNNGPEPGRDGGRDGATEDVAFDALPPIDVQPKQDVDRTDCPDADATFIYLVSSQNGLYSFYPPTLTFKFIGNLVCPSNGSTPFSMGVDRKGVAYVVFTDGNLYRVSTATAACIKTSFVPNQEGFSTFGMGFASELGGPAERLYVAENNFNGASAGLGRIDISTFKLSFVNDFSPSIPRAELTGTGDGRLFAFWPDRVLPTGSHVAEVNKTTAQVIAKSDLPVARTNDAFAFAFWGGDFWIFTSPGGASEVHRFRPIDGSVTQMTTHPSTIVGAGVSTCAPQL
jgi:hypothetical protein